jgi:transposase
MSRGDLTDTQWERLKPHLPPEETGKPGGQWSPHRPVINGILWVDRTGAPWRDMPERYGPWQTCYDRLTRWQKDGTWLRLLQTLQQEADEQSNVEWEGCAVDSTSIKAHPHAAGAPRDPEPEAAALPEKRGRKASHHKASRSRKPHHLAKIGKRWGAVAAA